MEYQYITNKAGIPVAVIVPIQEWELLQSKLKEECLTEDEIQSAEAGWKEYLEGKGEDVEKIAQELVEETLREYDDLDDLFGRWSEDEFREIDSKINRERQRDKEIWE